MAKRVQEETSINVSMPNSLVVLIAGLRFPGSNLNWNHIIRAVNQFDVQPHYIKLNEWVKWLAVFIPRLRTTLADQLLKQIALASCENTRIAVIAHSFGSVILAQALKERPSTMWFDRVVLFGSALRPDFEWHNHLICEQMPHRPIGDFRNITGEKDSILSLARLWAKFERRFYRPANRMLGDAGRGGFTCDMGSPCERHNRPYRVLGYGGRTEPLGTHSFPLNLIDLPRWFSFLGIRRKINGLMFLDEVPRFRKRLIERVVSSELAGLLRDKAVNRVLVEGPKASGKSSLVAKALLDMFRDPWEDRPPVYYVDGPRIQARPDDIQTAIAKVPEGATLFLDDVHHSKAAIEVATEAVEHCKGKVILVSRELGENEYRQLHDRFGAFENPTCVLFEVPPPQEIRREVATLAQAALAAQEKLASPDDVGKFVQYYGWDLAELFDALEAWTPGNPVTEHLADEGAVRRLEDDAEFSLMGYSGEAVRAVFLTVAAFGQVERPVPGGFFWTALGLDSEIAYTLAKRGTLEDLGVSGAHLYKLDHEQRARRYVRIAEDREGLTVRIRTVFADKNLQYAHDPKRLAGGLWLLWILQRHEAERTSAVREIHDDLMFRGYGRDFIDISGRMKQNETILGGDAYTQLLVDGGGARRRFGSLDEAEAWLKEARCREEAAGKQGGILYELAYLPYDRAKFERAEAIFKESAGASQGFWRWVSIAKAAEAKFQQLMVTDSLQRNLEPDLTRDESTNRQLQEVVRILAEAIAEIGKEREKTRARHWEARARMHWADVCLELGDHTGAANRLEEAKDVVTREVPSYQPVFWYLQGRLALMRGERTSALRSFQTALEGYERGVREVEGLGELFIGLGDVWWLGDQPEVAVVWYARASVLEIEREHGQARAVDAAKARLKRVWEEAKGRLAMPSASQ